MRYARIGTLAVGLLGVLGQSDQARGQAAALAPTVGQAIDGVSLNVTPAVSADRRYVRLSIGAGFQSVDGFSNIAFPAAVVGGGGGAGPGLGGLAGMNGPIGPGPMRMDPGWAYEPIEDLSAWRPAPRRTRADRSRAARVRKADPDPVIVPAKKKP